ncbi:MAG: hypothetical protein ACRDXB_05855 [Actinomycetes bacterium]
MPSLRALTAVRHVAEWHVRSQQTARRNALIASTALADRRRQRIEVDEFLEDYSRRRGRTATDQVAGWR